MTGRLMIGWGMWVMPKLVSAAATIGIAPIWHNTLKNNLGVDLTLAVTAGGPRWWAVTATYRPTYVIPTSDEGANSTLYHQVGLTLLVPREGLVSLTLQGGVLIGDVSNSPEKVYGFVGLIGVLLMMHEI